jgi:hypothetical protein
LKTDHCFKYRGMSRIRFDHVAQAKRSGSCDHADEAATRVVVLFFGSVNQVLVRLWARHQQVLVHGFGRSIRF